MTTRATAIADHFAGLAAASDPDALHIGDTVEVPRGVQWDDDRIGTVTAISATGKTATVSSRYYVTHIAIARLIRVTTFTVVLRLHRITEVATFDSYADAVAFRDKRNAGTGSTAYSITAV